MYVTCYHQSYCDMQNVNVVSEKEICCNIRDVETWNHCGSVGGGNVAENMKLVFSSSKRPDNLEWMFFCMTQIYKHISRTNFIINLIALSWNNSDQDLWNLVASSVTLSEASEARGGKVWCGPLLLVFTFVFAICIYKLQFVFVICIYEFVISICNLYLHKYSQFYLYLSIFVFVHGIRICICICIIICKLYLYCFFYTGLCFCIWIWNLICNHLWTWLSSTA